MNAGRAIRVAARFVLPVAAAAAFLAGCAALQQVAALRQVDFDIDRVDDGRIAGVRLEGKRTYSDLTTLEVARIGAALVSGDLPLSMIVHVAGENPAENDVTARLVRMEWTLFVEDKETISGVLDEEYQLPPGETTDIPIRIELDLLDFFDGRANDLFDVARAAAGISEPTNVSLRARPVIETPIGPIRYPVPITIVSKEVGRI